MSPVIKFCVPPNAKTFDRATFTIIMQTSNLTSISGNNSQPHYPGHDSNDSDDNRTNVLMLNGYQAEQQWMFIVTERESRELIQNGYIYVK